MRDIPFTVRGLHRLLRRPCPRCPCLYQVLHRLARLGRFASSLRGHHLIIGIADFTCGGNVPRSSANGKKNFIFSYHTIGGPNGCRHCGPFAKLSRPIVHFLRSSNRVTMFLRRTCTLISTSIGHCVRHNFAGLSIYFNYANKRRHSICSTRRLTRRLRGGFNMRIGLVRERRGVRRAFGTGIWYTGIEVYRCRDRSFHHQPKRPITPLSKRRTRNPHSHDEGTRTKANSATIRKDEVRQSGNRCPPLQKTSCQLPPYPQRLQRKSSRRQQAQRTTQRQEERRGNAPLSKQTEAFPNTRHKCSSKR